MKKTSASLDFLKASLYGKYTEDILTFYVPLVISLPKLRSNPRFLSATVKGISENSGIEDIVTESDKYMQKQIKEETARLHPDWQFWGEEGEDNISQWEKDKQFLLITDPIEGTINFRAKKDIHWGSVIALVESKTKKPVIGIVAYPHKKIFYVGVSGTGAFILKYDNKGKLQAITPMKNAAEKGFETFTYNNSAYFRGELAAQAKRFISFGKVKRDKKNATDLEKSRKTVVLQYKGKPVVFEDLESGALEVIRNRGTIYFKTSNEMAAVFVIFEELGGKVTDADGKPWTLGINSLISARNKKDYQYLKTLIDKARERS
jgi:myo-inositol-1(or 4)-monophosphatase